MTRRSAALLSALSLALCYARAGSWAAPAKGEEVHACCRHGDSGKTATLNDCCVPPAAGSAVRLVRVDAPAIPTAVPVAHPPLDVVDSVLFAPAPSAGRVFREAAPARAPPLA